MSFRVHSHEHHSPKHLAIRDHERRLIEPPREHHGHSDAPGTLACDEEAAVRSDAKLLITAPTPSHVEALARRIHAAGARAALPFVQARACDLLTDRQILGTTCSRLLDTTAGGSLLIGDVEGMERIVQDVLIELLAELELARRPRPPVRLISGTTVSLLDRVEAGTFSARLFYRLNTIHLLAKNGNGASASR